MNPSRFAIRSALICALLCLSWLAFLYPAFGSDRFFSLYEDNEFLLGPIFSSVSRIMRAGNLPLRFDEILGGFPLYNFTQITPYYPFYGFLFDIYNGFLPTLRSLHNLTLLHLLLMLFNMYYLLRVLGVITIASVMGAICFTFSADTLSYAKWINITAPYSWLPLYIAGLIGVLRGGFQLKNIILIVISVIMIVTSSPSQPLIHALLISICIVSGFLIKELISKSLSATANSLFLLVGIAIICALICLPFLLPPVVEAGKMIRWIGNFPAIFLNSRVPFDAFIYYKLPIQDLWRLFLYTPGNLVGGAYVGFFAIPLIIFAFIRGITWVPLTFVFIAFYALFSAFGDDLGFAYVNHAIPLLNKIREPSRNLALFHFSVSILASIGLGNIAIMLNQGGSIGNKAKYLMVFSALVISLIYAYVFFLFANGAYVKNVFGDFQYILKFSESIRFLLCLLLILATAAAFYLRSIFFRRFILYSWPAATVISLYTAVSWQPPLSISDSIYVQKNMAPLEMAILEVQRRDPNANFRVLFDGDIDKGQASMLAAYHGVRSFSYYINPAPINQAVDFEWSGYSLYYRYEGAAYLICKKCQIDNYPGFIFLNSQGDYRIYYDASAYPRIYSAHIEGSFTDTKDFINKVKNSPLAGLHRALISNSNQSNYIKSRNLDSCSMKILSKSSNRYDIVAECEAGIAFVLNEYNDGNWISKINGKLVDVVRINGNQNGVISKGGTQFISFEYRPAIFFRSVYVSILGILLLISLIFFSHRYYTNLKNK